MRTLSLQSAVVASEQQVSSDLGGEAVILSLADGTYYGLDAVGARVWELLQRPSTVAELRDAVLREYEVEEEQCTRDLLVLLEQMMNAHLIKPVE